VRLGDNATRWFYVGLVVAAFVAIVVAAVGFRPAAVTGLAAVAFAVAPVRRILAGARGAELIGVLGATGRLQLAVGALTAVGLAIGGWT
jgi:1,4-dihydroxy-2-naphthoate octaprenyltransferase